MSDIAIFYSTDWYLHLGNYWTTGEQFLQLHNDVLSNKMTSQMFFFLKSVRIHRENSESFKAAVIDLGKGTSNECRMFCPKSKLMLISQYPAWRCDWLLPSHQNYGCILCFSKVCLLMNGWRFRSSKCNWTCLLKMYASLSYVNIGWHNGLSPERRLAII